MRFPIAIYRVAEHSMEPSLHAGDYIMVNMWSREFRPGDVVLLKSPEDGRVLVKRIKSISKSVFVAGDNERESRDSRKFGSVAAGAIIGKVMGSI